MKIRINGTGCSLIDFLYNNVDFSSDEFRGFMSRSDGDGGLSPGKLVFTKELESFSGKKLPDIIKEAAGNRPPDTTNLGGPAIVSLINAAQLTFGRDISVKFKGIRGNDETGKTLQGFIDKTPVDASDYLIKQGITPATTVLSDPNYDNGNGERAFINTIGAADDLLPSDLGIDFYDTHVAVFGGTALVPRIHDNIHILLERAKEREAVTVVTTVYDFRNQKKNLSKPWPLGEGEKTLPLIDLLIMDQEEAERISGLPIRECGDYFIKNGAGAFIITRGAENLLIYSSSKLFSARGVTEIPVSQAVKKDLQEQRERGIDPGDTTGCGDNFAGGVLASLALQLTKKCPGRLNLMEACAWGVASGGFACFYTGGTYFEKTPGEKTAKIEPYYRDYLNQL